MLPFLHLSGRELEDQVSPGDFLLSDGGNIAVAALRSSYNALAGTNAKFAPSTRCACVLIVCMYAVHRFTHITLYTHFQGMHAGDA